MAPSFFAHGHRGGKREGDQFAPKCFVSVVAHLFQFFLRFTVVVSTVGSAEAEAEAELRDGGREGGR